MVNNEDKRTTDVNKHSRETKHGRTTVKRHERRLNKDHTRLQDGVKNKISDSYQRSELRHWLYEEGYGENVTEKEITAILKILNDQNMEVREIEAVNGWSDDPNNPMEVDVGGSEFMVVTEPTARDIHEQYTAELIDDLGLSAFTEQTQNEIIYNHVAENYFEQEQKDSVWKDIEDYNKKEQEELYERYGIEKPTDGDLSELVNAMTSNRSPVQWYSDKYGNAQLKREVEKRELYKIPEISNYLAKQDGLEHMLSSNPRESDEVFLNDNDVMYYFKTD